MLLELVTAMLMAAQTIYGVAIAGDGDSLSIGKTRVRFFGIDAPEFDQTCKRGSTDWSCGREAADHLSSLVTGKEVRCIPVSTDQYGREVSRCTVGALDVNRDMVATGYAIAYRHYSLDYVGAEESAKANGRGLWSALSRCQASFEPSGRSGDLPDSSTRLPHALMSLVGPAPA